MTGFEPWEIPTGGAPPELRLGYGTDAGRRYVVNASAWMLLIRRADGRIEPLPRTAEFLRDGDEVLPPNPQVEPIDPRVLFETKTRCFREYDAAMAARVDADGNVIEGSVGGDYRWYWYKRDLPHGRVIHLQPAGANARLTVSLADGAGPEGTWCYADHAAGWRAALGWNGEGDPPDGWHRHMDTGRRRKDGTAATEYIPARDLPAKQRVWRRGQVWR